jgi:hypothetical protein
MEAIGELRRVGDADVLQAVADSFAPNTQAGSMAPNISL